MVKIRNRKRGTIPSNLDNSEEILIAYIDNLNQFLSEYAYFTVLAKYK